VEEVPTKLPLSLQEGLGKSSIDSQYISNPDGVHPGLDAMISWLGLAIMKSRLMNARSLARFEGGSERYVLGSGSNPSK
jgi:hypothetical protein